MTTPSPYGRVLLQTEGDRAVPGELVQLHERAGVEQQVDALAGGLLAARVLLLHRAGGAGVHRVVDPRFEVGEPSGGGVDVDLGGALLPSHCWIVTTRLVRGAVQLTSAVSWLLPGSLLFR